MKINDRLTKIESLQRSRMLPAPTLIWVVYEPSEAGPREVGAFTRIRSSAGYTTLWRDENECQNNFEARIEFHRLH
jgi:hypothetical protein